MTDQAGNQLAPNDLTEKRFTAGTRWLNQALPAEIQSKLESPALAAYERQLAKRLDPISRKDFAVISDQLLAFCRQFDVGDADVEKLLGFWWDAVKHLPAHAVQAGVSDICRTWRYRNPPKPVDLAEACQKHAAEELAAQTRLQWERRRAQWRQPDPNPEERADPEKVRAFLESFEKAFATEGDQETAA